MAEMTIRLRINPETGKKDILVSLRSDEDALPQEHEQQHRALVDKLMEGGVLSAADLGQIVVEREEDERQPAARADSAPQDQRQAQAEGQ
jgi:hypothetical protein